jgi:hypothetical protein
VYSEKENNGVPGLPNYCVVTILDGKLTLSHGLSFLFREIFPYCYPTSCCLTIDILEEGGVKFFQCDVRGSVHQLCKIPKSTSFETILDLFPAEGIYYSQDRLKERQGDFHAMRAMLAQSREMLDGMDKYWEMLDGMDKYLDEALAGQAETRDNDCILVGDDDCLIVEDDRTKTGDDDCILLGDDDCRIVEDA